MGNHAQISLSFQQIFFCYPTFKVDGGDCIDYPKQGDEISKHRDENLSQGRHPKCFGRGPVPVSPGFPLKACGNDGLGLGS